MRKRKRGERGVCEREKGNERDRERQGERVEKCKQTVRGWDGG